MAFIPASAFPTRLIVSDAPFSALRMVAPTETAEDAKAILLRAAKTRDQEPEAVIEAIRFLEKTRESSTSKFDLLTKDGNWRLIFTTGDVKTQKKIGGKISYVPIKAVQVFKPDFSITNGVYLGSFPLLKFTGTFTWAEDKSRLEFTFDRVAVLGFEFPYNQGESKVQPGFTFIEVTTDFVIARGAGGGLALWLRQDTV
ncbi:unnamed protein product [Choristocarpus tenellus]